MTEAKQHPRLAEIQLELKSMGITSTWIEEYVKLSKFYPDPANDMPSHNGVFLMLPADTMPHDIYTEKLTQLIEDLEKAEACARSFKKVKPSIDEIHKDEYVRRYGKGAYDQEMGRQAELRKQYLARPKEIQYELYIHLTRFRPINVKDFHDKINALVKEQIDILTNIRISEASMAAYVSPIPLA